ncbi:tyrosine-type recombinase/integrase [Anaerospora sp.]|uniref:tyrosine-type recombinase/integrase n=1 Tax=Anaerospora sp. TaxID=1960278 RepID=UPI00289938C5|nr:tyrosine-type recombinase/integrase [Anaerospora sp.]
MTRKENRKKDEEAKIEVNIDFYLEEFLAWRKLEVSEYTVINFRNNLRRFFRQYGNSIINNEKSLLFAVKSFLQPMKAGYFNKTLQSLKQFFEYLKTECVIAKNPCQGIGFKAYTPKIVNLADDVIRELIDLPDKSTFRGLRDYALILTLLDCGIRPNEAVQLNKKDINFLNSQIIVREEYSKTRTMRVLPLSIKSLQAIRRLLSVRPQEWKDSVPIFCTSSGTPFDTHDLQWNFRQYSKQLGVNVTPYSLRHQFALYFLRNGGNVFALQKIMGHTKLEMTRNYIAIVESDIIGNHEKASPVANLLKESKRVRKV